MNRSVLFSLMIAGLLLPAGAGCEKKEEPKIIMPKEHHDNPGHPVGVGGNPSPSGTPAPAPKPEKEAEKAPAPSSKP